MPPLLDRYLQEGEMRLYSPRTLESRRLFIGSLLWFLEHREYAMCGEEELRHFFHYLAHGHKKPGGRFGRKHLNRPVRPVTMKDYYNCLRPFFDWLVERRHISGNPFQFIPPPHVREEVKAPLSLEQVQTLFASASRSTQPLRDTAILALLLDTGCHAGELISIQLEDVGWRNRCCRVLGKGNKYRTLYFGDRTNQVLQSYVEASGRLLSDADNAGSNAFVSTPLFLSDAACPPAWVPGTRGFRLL